MKFELEILAVASLKGVHMVKLTKIQGDIAKYNKLNALIHGMIAL